MRLDLVSNLTILMWNWTNHIDSIRKSSIRSIDVCFFLLHSVSLNWYRWLILSLIICPVECYEFQWTEWSEFHSLNELGGGISAAAFSISCRNCCSTFYFATSTHHFHVDRKIKKNGHSTLLLPPFHLLIYISHDCIIMRRFQSKSSARFFIYLYSLFKTFSFLCSHRCSTMLRKIPTWVSSYRYEFKIFTFIFSGQTIRHGQLTKLTLQIYESDTKFISIFVFIFIFFQNDTVVTTDEK